MNLARTYLTRAYPDLTYGSRLERAEADGQLGYAAALLRVLHSLGRGIATPGASVVDAGREIEQRELARLRSWRDTLAQAVGDASLSDVEVVFAELASPQAVTAHEQDDSYAVGIDRRLSSFLGTLSVWAYFASRMRRQGASRVDANSEFLEVLAEQVQLCYLDQALPDSFEQRSLALQQSFTELEIRFVDALSSQAIRFIFYHELAHVHLKHFSKATAEPLVAAASGRISAFADQQLEFEADQFASRHLVGPQDGLAESLAARVAPSVFFYLLALKEAMTSSSVAGTQVMLRTHPPAAERAERLKADFTPPGVLPAFEIVLGVPALLVGVLESPAFAAAARYFRARTSASPSQES